MRGNTEDDNISMTDMVRRQAIVSKAIVVTIQRLMS